MSDDIAELLDAGDVCGAAVRADELLDETVRAVNAGDVPPALQEPLTARANELVNAVNCPPPVETEAETTETETIETETQPAEEEPEDEDEGEANGKKKDKDKKDADE